MAEIKIFGPFRLLRSDASAHIQLYQRGERRKSGRGLAFWFMPDGASIAQIPMDDRDLPFLFKSRSRDFQEVTVQGVVVWRVSNPEAMADRIDFSIDLRQGVHLGRPLDQIDSLLTGVAQQFAAQYLAELDIGEILSGGVKPLHERIERGRVTRESGPGFFRRLRGADQLDDRIKMIEGNLQTFKNVSSSLGLVKLKLSSTGDHILAMTNVFCQNLFQSQSLR